jgi:hypothetical protein
VETKDNGRADLLTVDLLAVRVQRALGQMLTVTEALWRLLAEGKKLARRSPPEVSARLSAWVTDAENCLEALGDVQGDLYAADYLATSLQLKTDDEGDRSLRMAMCIAAAGGHEFPFTPPPKPPRKRPRRASRRGSPDGAAA